MSKVMKRINLDIQESRSLINEVVTEISTRIIVSLRMDMTVNYQEFLNNLFVTNENLRSMLSGKKDHRFNIFVIEKILSIIQYNYMITNKWNQTYTTWNSSFKSKRNNHDVLTAGDSFVFANYQILFPNFQDIAYDLEHYDKFIRETIKQLLMYDQIIDEYGSFQTKNFLVRWYHKTVKHIDITIPDSKYQTLNELFTAFNSYQLIEDPLARYSW